MDDTLDDPFPGHHTIGIASTQNSDLFLHARRDHDATPRKQMIDHQLPLALKLAGRDQRTGIEDYSQHRWSPFAMTPLR